MGQPRLNAPLATRPRVESPVTWAPNAKLTKEQAEQIATRGSAGERSTDLAKEFGVSSWTIGNLVRGQSWSGLKSPYRTGDLRLGSNCYLAKLTEREVQRIRRLHQEGASITDLSKEYGMSKNNIHCIVRRKTWKHVK